MKIFVTRVLPKAIKQLLLNEGHAVSEWTEKRDLTAAELIHNSLANDALFSIGKNKIDKAFLAACNHLRVIALCSVGYDNVDVTEVVTRR